MFTVALNPTVGGLAAPFQANVRVQFGGLYNGTQRMISSAMTRRASYKLRAMFSVQRTAVVSNVATGRALIVKFTPAPALS